MTYEEDLSTSPDEQENDELYEDEINEESDEDEIDEDDIEETETKTKKPVHEDFKALKQKHKQKMQEKEDEIAKLKAQLWKDVGALDPETLSQVVESQVQQVMRLRELQAENPDLDISEVQRVARLKSLSIDEAFKLVNYDTFRKTKRNLTGKPARETKTSSISAEELSKLSGAEYAKMSADIKAGKVKLY